MKQTDVIKKIFPNYTGGECDWDCHRSVCGRYSLECYGDTDLYDIDVSTHYGVGVMKEDICLEEVAHFCLILDTNLYRLLWGDVTND